MRSRLLRLNAVLLLGRSRALLVQPLRFCAPAAAPSSSSSSLALRVLRAVPETTMSDAGAAAETKTARELKKALRRMQHNKETPKEVVLAMEERYAAAAAMEQRVMTLKGDITVARKAAQAAPSEKELEAKVVALQDEYCQLTGETAYRRGAKRVREKAEAQAHDKMAPPPAASTFPAYTPRDYFRFEVVHESTKSRARVGRIHTPHGIIDTPAFVPVGTNGALKAVDSFQALEAGVQLQFCNTYHLMVHPGADVVERAGGLHKFMLRDAPIITDSGGFQVFSLADSDDDEDGPELKMKRTKRKRDDEASKTGGSQGQLLKVSEQGTVFRSYLDGQELELTPESSVEAQKKFGADIIIPLDELPPYHVTCQRLEESVQLSHRWMARSLRTHLADPRKQAMYCVIHGGVDRDLRQRSVEYLSTLPFDGYAIGGSLGKDREEMNEMLGWLMPLVPRGKPNHVLGIAEPESALALVPMGVDTMDSCNPTRIARHGSLLTSEGICRIKRSVFFDNFTPIDPNVETIPYTKAYLHHLFKQNEPLALTLASVHNIKYMNHVMADMRAKIMRNEL